MLIADYQISKPLKYGSINKRTEIRKMESNQFAINLSIAIISEPNIIIDTAVGNHVEDLLAKIIEEFIINQSKHKLGTGEDAVACKRCGKSLSEWRVNDFCKSNKIETEVKGDVKEHHFRCENPTQFHEFSVLVKPDFEVGDTTLDTFNPQRTKIPCPILHCYFTAAILTH